MVGSHRFTALLLAGLLVPAAAEQRFLITPAVQEALDRISADSLRGHVSFLAADELAGRDTPSPGLDVAAEYIAAQFRRAGMEPAGGDGYFQTATLALVDPRPKSMQLMLTRGAESVRIEPGQVAASWTRPVQLNRAAAYKWTGGALPGKAEIAGKVVMAELGGSLFRDLRRLQALEPAAILVLARRGIAGRQGQPRLVDPNSQDAAPPVIYIGSPDLERLFDALPAGAGEALADLRLDAPEMRQAAARNVVALLRGSDPVLRDTYVLLTAHYDHVGVRPGGEGDRIFNGANDDASGTASLLELAAALSRSRPRRSLVFLAFFGEERGSLGARWYVRHPLVPIERTVADINLEQLGRTDSSEGPRLNSATFTGFDYSDLPAVFRAAGEVTGVRIYKHERNSDPYFSRSDNQVLADQGIPAHTLCVTFEYPDYHGVDDEWEKLDYANMARVNRMVALGLLMLADDGQPPRWNEANPRTAAYVRVWKQRHAKAD